MVHALKEEDAQIEGGQDGMDLFTELQGATGMYERKVVHS